MFLRKQAARWACLLALAGAGWALADEVRIGVFSFQGEQAAASDWSPLSRYLNQALPNHHFQLEYFDAAGLREAIAGQHVDLVITNPGYYVTMEAQFGLSRIATLDAPGTSPARALGSVVIARAQRDDLRELSDLGGKRLAAVAPDAFGGYLLAAREFKRQGVDPETGFKSIRFIGLPMSRIIEAVRDGEVDAGIVRACLPEQLAQQGRLRMEDFRVLSPRSEAGLPCALSTPLYPDWPIAVTRRMDPELAKRVARALLAMPDAPGSIAWSVPADYQPVHELYRDLRLGPYAYLREITPGGLARRFWPWLLGIAAFLIAWVFHTIRVEHLVHQKTAELRESLAARDAAEQRTRESQEQMEHLSRLSVLGELSGSLAHELNQPLTTIGTYARTVLRRQESGKLTDEAITEACGEIAHEAERAGGIIQRIRDFTKKRAASRDPVDLLVVAEEARRLIVGLLATPPEIAIVSRLSASCQVLADAPQIQQVLLNLIKNAIDAGRDLPADRQGIQVSIEAAENRALVHVTDHGVGLEEAQLAHLFEPFFTTKPDGLGLGLPICKTIIEAHGGRLWAERNVDAPGLRFSFSLPCHDPELPR